MGVVHHCVWQLATGRGSGMFRSETKDYYSYFITEKLSVRNQKWIYLWSNIKTWEMQAFKHRPRWVLCLFFFFLLQFTSFDISGPTTFTPAPNSMSPVPFFLHSPWMCYRKQHYQNRTPYLSAYFAFAASFFLYDINMYDIKIHFLIVVLDSWIRELIK